MEKEVLNESEFSVIRIEQRKSFINFREMDWRHWISIY